MPNQKKGLRIGLYRITPLGMGVFGGLIAVVAAIIVAIVLLTGGSPDAHFFFNLAVCEKWISARPLPIIRGVYRQ